MPDIALLGLNYKTAPVALRECLAFSLDEADAALERLRKADAIEEVFLLSTCNRVEILLTTHKRSEAFQTVKTFLSETKNLPLEQFEEALYFYIGHDAVRHLFKVASSLDSLVVGEPQILGQMKEAYRLAVRQGASAVILNRLLHKTFAVAKRVRTETGIGDHAVSISYAAVELGFKIFDVFEAKKTLLIGTGEMAELAVEHLIRHKVETIFVTNRTFENALRLAKRFNGKAIRFEEIDAYLALVDIIISSTGAPDYIIRPEQVKRVMRKRRQRPIFFVDIAVPRDIHPGINQLANAYVYDIDDLKGVIEENIQDRRHEALRAEGIIEEAVIRFENWYKSLDVIPTIVGLREKLETISEAEVDKTLKAMGHWAEPERQAMRRMTAALINKFLHHPTILLKQDHAHRDKSKYIAMVRKLFQLDE